MGTCNGALEHHMWEGQGVSGGKPVRARRLQCSHILRGSQAPAGARRGGRSSAESRSQLECLVTF